MVHIFPLIIIAMDKRMTGASHDEWAQGVSSYVCNINMLSPNNGQKIQR